MNSYLETGIAVMLIIVTFSILAYVIQELIAANLQFRGKMLASAINLLLGGSADPFAIAFFNHPQIKMLEKRIGKFQRPSYIPSANFAMAILDVKRSEIVLNKDLTELFASWQNITSATVPLHAVIEKWYDEYMDRVGGWYKKEYRWVTRVLAIVIALGFNLNLINITKTVHHDTVLKASLVAAAEKMADQPDALKQYYTQKIEKDVKAVEESFAIKMKNASAADSLRLLKEQEAAKDSLLTDFNKQQSQIARGLIDSLPAGKLIFGWKHWPWQEQETKVEKPPFIGWCRLTMLISGLFLGACAISMGAPFWFALLVKVVNIRRAGIKPPVSK